MRSAFILSFLANVIMSVVSFAILPDRVAIHFGPGGSPNGWASNLTNTLIMLSVHTLVFCSLYFSPRLIARVPSKWISLPNRDFWLAPQNRANATEMFSHYIWLFLFMLFTGLLALRANLSEPVRLDETVFLAALVIFLAYTVYWTIVLLRAFRKPV
jgi:uncharacterized membrane protein